MIMCVLVQSSGGGFESISVWFCEYFKHTKTLEQHFSRYEVNQLCQREYHLKIVSISVESENQTVNKWLNSLQVQIFLGCLITKKKEKSGVTKLNNNIRDNIPGNG